MPAPIRRATVDDIDGLLALRAAVAAEGVWIGAEVPLDLEGDRASHRESVEAQAANPDAALLLVALVDDVVVGSLHVGVRAGIGDLGMCLRAEARGHGLGRRLLDDAIGWARGAGLHKLTLAHWPWNHRAHALYVGAGFVEEGYLRRHWPRRDGSLWDAVVMGLVLDHERPGHEARATEPPGHR